MTETNPTTNEDTERKLVAQLKSASCIFPSGDGVTDLTLDIPAGSIFGFVGPSGSGKTTTVRLMTGVVAPTDGTVVVLGTDPFAFTSEDRARLGYMPQRSVLYPNLSVWENLRFFSALYGMGLERQPLEEVLDFVELTDHQDKRVSEVSGGMQRRLSLAAALVHDPDVLFLDEPTAGIDPVLRRKLWDRFRELRDDGKTLFVTTQYVGEAAYCDKVGVLSDGELLTVDTPDGLRREAFGGDVIHVDFSEPPSPGLLTEISQRTGAHGFEMYSTRGVELVVDEAAVTLPELSSWLSERDVAIDKAEEYLPPFDDVFVELVEAHRNGQNVADDLSFTAPSLGARALRSPRSTP